LLIGVLPNVPGFLVTIKVLAADAVPEWIAHLYYYAWFVGFLVSGIAYMLLMQAYKPGVATIKETSSYVAID